MTEEEDNKTGVTGRLARDTEKKIAFYAAIIGLLDFLFKILTLILEKLEVILSMLEPRSALIVRNIRLMLERLPRKLTVIIIIVIYELWRRRKSE